MRARSVTWLIAHAGLTLLALRISEVSGRAGFPAGVGLGIVSGFLVVTLLASVRNLQKNDERETHSLQSYCAQSCRLPGHCDFIGAVITCILWFALCSSPFFTGFKIWWAVAALLTARVLADSSC